MEDSKSTSIPKLQNYCCQHRNKFDLNINERIGELSKPNLTSDKRFDNPFSTWKAPNLFHLAKWVLTEKNESNVPSNKDELDKEVPILKPNFIEEQRNRNDSCDYKLTWIGHATCLIQVDQLNILTDPIFSQRASPSQYFGPKRYRDAACNISALPPIHYVIVSHSHYDHLDSNSVTELNKRFGKQCCWLVPSGLGSYLKSMSVENFVELNWWQKHCCCCCCCSKQQLSLVKDDDENNNNLINHQETSIYLTPNQHWSKRSAFDYNKSLWGSYTIVSKRGSTFFFGGDTGYCKAFREIGEIFGPFTGAAIPIGAYAPRWFMSPAHVDPQDAVKIHQDLQSLKSIGIHHLTFTLTNEFYKEPANILKEIMNNDKKLSPFITLKHGETTEFYSSTST